jgi:hypothetical protein
VSILFLNSIDSFGNDSLSIAMRFSAWVLLMLEGTGFSQKDSWLFLAKAVNPKDF